MPGTDTCRRKMSEKDFRRWITTNAPSDWLMQPIETATGNGVPDLFICHDGCSCWAELKSSASPHCYMRISQWRWFHKLTSRGGFALLIIKREKQKRVDVYKATDLTRYNAADCILKGEDIIFPPNTKVSFSYKLGSGNKRFFEDLDNLLQNEYED